MTSGSILPLLKKMYSWHLVQYCHCQRHVQVQYCHCQKCTRDIWFNTAIVKNMYSWHLVQYCPCQNMHSWHLVQYCHCQKYVLMTSDSVLTLSKHVLRISGSIMPLLETCTHDIWLNIAFVRNMYSCELAWYSDWQLKKICGIIEP